ncbi:MAG: hypothetical protein JNL88_01845 [Bacteroidia bacterium]|nr:hypothetical protein [Bacteroidia bacterium]
MKKILLSLLLFSAGTFIAAAQTKTAANVVSELCNATNFPGGNSQFTSADVVVILGGHGAPTMSFGHGTGNGTVSNIKTVTPNPNLPGLNYKSYQFFLATTIPTYTYVNRGGAKFNGSKFKLTLTNGPLSTNQTSVGTLQILYGDGTTKSVVLPTGMTVTGTSLSTGYTLSGKVAGEFGDEEITIILKTRLISFG